MLCLAQVLPSLAKILQFWRNRTVWSTSLDILPTILYTRVNSSQQWRESVQILEYIKQENGFPSWEGYQLWVLENTGAWEPLEEEQEDFERRVISKKQQVWYYQQITEDSAINSVTKMNELKSLTEEWDRR